MSHDISVTTMARRFAEYVNRVAYRGESFVLVKGKRRLAEIRPLPTGRRLAELPDLLASLPRLSGKDAERFAVDIETARRESDPGVRDPWAS